MRKIIILISSLFGIGFIPIFSGTIASILGIIIFFILKYRFYFLIFSIFSIILSFLISGKAEEIFKEKDSKKIVIDDFSGMLLVLIFTPRNLTFIIFSFFLFRAFDALKVPPIDTIERLSGSVGIVFDDLLAGVYTIIIILILNFFIKFS